ncbi:hypothetical protein GQ55_9G131200 [Panicum hallii var. hallii]|uniref:Uncharacterized protein n=1 Tax=Panicum hallii var. hallii TaxID=1504633 RepID=A0A2T7C2M1_9POAL|nr:hypothetical protein GQ55_9G131200 [Panicum hallii var. hallii]
MFALQRRHCECVCVDEAEASAPPVGFGGFIFTDSFSLQHCSLQACLGASRRRLPASSLERLRLVRPSSWRTGREPGRERGRGPWLGAGATENRRPREAESEGTTEPGRRRLGLSASASGAGLRAVRRRD